MHSRYGATVSDLSIRPYRPSDEAEVVALWHTCGLVVLWNDPHQDVALKLGVQPELFLVGELHGRVVATVMAGFDGHRGWLNYVAVAPECRRQGVGRAVVERAEADLARLGCPKVNLQVRATNAEVVAFYHSLGYQVEERVSMGKRL